MARNKVISVLSVRLATDMKGFSAGLTAAQGRLARWGKGVKAGLGGALQSAAGGFAKLGGAATMLTASLGPVGAALAGIFAITKLVTGAINGLTNAFASADQAAKDARALGTTQQTLEAMQLAAAEAGSTSEALFTALAKVQKGASEAAQGTGELQAVFKELGIDAAELARMTPDQAAVRLGKAIEGLPTQADRVRVRLKLFEEQGAKLGATFTALANGGLADAEQAVEAYGVALSEVDQANIEAMNDSWGRTQLALRGVFTQIAAQLAPAINDFLQMVNTGLRWFIEGLKEARRWLGVDADAFDLVTAQAKNAARAMDEAAASEALAKQAEQAKLLAEAEEKAKEELEKWTDVAGRMIDRVKTPIERLSEESEQLNEIWKRGLITWNSMERIARDIVDRVIDAEESQMRRIRELRTPNVGFAGSTGTGGDAGDRANTLLQQAKDQARTDAERARRQEELDERRNELLRELGRYLERGRDTVTVKPVSIVG